MYKFLSEITRILSSQNINEKEIKRILGEIVFAFLNKKKLSEDIVVLLFTYSYRLNDFKFIQDFLLFLEFRKCSCCKCNFIDKKLLNF